MLVKELVGLGGKGGRGCYAAIRKIKGISCELKCPWKNFVLKKFRQNNFVTQKITTTFLNISLRSLFIGDIEDSPLLSLKNFYKRKL